ncbi:unnamed protein product, partial [marine sediment metagenome]
VIDPSGMYASTVGTALEGGSYYCSFEEEEGDDDQNSKNITSRISASENKRTSSNFSSTTSNTNSDTSTEEETAEEEEEEEEILVVYVMDGNGKIWTIPVASSGGAPITGQGNPSGQPVGGNSTEQFYSNSPDAYNYMWTNSFDAKGNPRVEISAWKTDKGIIVMPYYKNGIDYSYNDYLKVRTIDGSRYVTYNDNQYLITGHVHTHPSYNNGNIGLSGGDYDMINYIHGPINVLWNNRIWQVNGRTSSPIDLGGW